ncbi:MAG: exodeoxyribonuclease III [Devosiaceae bacterium]|nr:exodeoxyribonuclease III [Devosiaceae bacterium]
MPITLATWNINSVRLRREMVVKFLNDTKPDILALQEIKCTNDHFPAEFFANAGYQYQAINGQKSYHGVALLSRLPLNNINKRTFCNIEQSRHISANISYKSRNITIHNFYIPAGGDEADREINPKFAHKLDFYSEMQSWFDEPDFRKNQIIVGDFNIAPHENDVWSHKQLLKVVSHTPQEIELLNRLRDRGNWVDVIRKHIPTSERLYSWWSYRAKDWNKADKGRRLDHIWASPDVAELSTVVKIIREARGWKEKPSDHVPLVATFE